MPNSRRGHDLAGSASPARNASLPNFDAFARGHFITRVGLLLNGSWYWGLALGACFLLPIQLAAVFMSNPPNYHYPGGDEPSHSAWSYERINAFILIGSFLSLGACGVFASMGKKVERYAIIAYLTSLILAIIAILMAVINVSLERGRLRTVGLLLLSIADLGVILYVALAPLSGDRSAPPFP